MPLTDEQVFYGDFFKPVSEIHSYYTRYASQDNCYRPGVRTNYGKFTFKFYALNCGNQSLFLSKHYHLKSLKRNINTI